MNQVKLNLRNCYGIRELTHTFDFSKQDVYAIYAPNGSMKSSFAQTFQDVANGKPSADRIFPSRSTVRGITDENDADLPSESVLVLPPYDEFFSHNEKTSTLLLNTSLRREYEKLHADIDSSKAIFLKAMKKQSGSRKELDREIALTFTKTDDDESFYQALERVSTEVRDQSDAPFADVRYDSIFDDRILEALRTPALTTAIQDYILRYNELLDASTYFKKGVFEYYNAGQVARNLASNGFFDASHSLTLHAHTTTEITTQRELEALISQELDHITNDPKLKTSFAQIKKQLEKHAKLRAFQQYLCSNELLLPHLANVDLFKEKIWKSYFKANETLYEDLLSRYKDIKARLKAIESAARSEGTHWEAAIDLFNERFIVPFKLEAKNKAAVVFGHDSMLDLGYTFSDGGESAPVEREELMKSLSQGEKKALYILNIIFEIEVRRHAKQSTLFVVDDIADSFDYKNKYAIIQYLQDVSESPLFKQIILTHNFDFFRTVHSRFVGYSGCLMAAKGETKIELLRAFGIRNPFLLDWKAAFFTDKKKRVASISFMRNLIEHLHGSQHPDHAQLTSLLHWQPGSSNAIAQSQLDAIYTRLFGPSTSGFPARNELVVDMIHDEAEDCLKADEGVNFEHKIVLSIAIRLAAERFMVDRIADPDFVAGISSNQTPKLVKKFMTRFSTESSSISVLNRVALMTPENIHLNAFMYEPILDMSDNALKALYADVCNLQQPAHLASN
ncbi:MAG: phage infection protein [Acidobacteria bacterium]|nr:phage infection protein [Acidobacteriota bacterium]